MHNQVWTYIFLLIWIKISKHFKIYFRLANPFTNVIKGDLILKCCWHFTAGKIRIEHVTIFVSKYISKGTVDLKFSPDVGKKLIKIYTIYTKKNKTNKIRHLVMSYKMEWHRNKVLNREVQKGMESQDTSRYISVIIKHFCPLSVEINMNWFNPNTYSTRMKMKQDISARQWSKTQLSIS